ncbi:LacI family DNA-binding transcriptional regulator [Hoeflea prorocentri]|uniref:LacI family DNA-binding transcriptional regulator n=1 Tax=Hoeflea prorocentri TaxID=1922333 RepID=A0A9X3UFQ7_9HYPH|nr:LacI family DNA-binding transcriptional regulator [Hoeflea prorocentri]MCY6379715.1 LacI family DNA-binding transcriptional regulator [Hoeflea prorocentri]MDA5397515.1 LacI family DNA-binding transcriptional regulator [Hoeflea prorocentri]
MKRRQRTGKTVKIDDVAREANVSIMTVSRALRGVEGVSEGKRAEIFDIAERLRYQPNLNARSLVGVQSSLVGISFPTLFNDVFAEMLDGMRPALESAGLTTIVTTTEYDRERELNWVNTVRPWRPAALVLTGTDHDDKVRRILRRDLIPTLETWEYNDDPIDISVGIDHVEAGRQVAKEMIALGYRKPAYVGFEPGHDLRAEKRLLGIRTAFSDAGFGEVRTARHGTGDGYRSGYDGLMSVARDTQDRPDIVFFLSDHFAFAGLVACEELGLSVPEDIGIVGFNNLSINGVLSKKLTTVITPRREMGARGARNLIARINGIKTDLSLRLPAKIVFGDTTRRPLKAD